MKYIYAFCLFSLLCGTTVFAQDNATINALGGTRGAFVERFDNANAAFSVQVEVDRHDATYTEGDVLQAFVTSREDGYLYLFYRDANANVSVLFPNRYQQNNFIRRGERTPVPGSGAGFRLRIGAPFGHEQLTAVVSKRPLPFLDSIVEAKFRISPDTLVASINDNEGNSFANVMERQAGSPDWAEHSINIRTVPRGTRPPSGGTGGGTGTAKIHLILAADINDRTNVGRSVWADAHNVHELFKNNVDSGRLNVVDLETRRSGDLLTKNDILQAISGLNANSDDAIVFLYSGHGAIDSVAGHYLQLYSGDRVFRSEVLEALKSRRARLTVLISDCCSNVVDVDPSIRPRPAQGTSRGVVEIKGIRPLMEILFFETRGVVDITAAEDGTFGFVYPPEARYENGNHHKGSIFIWNFRNVMIQEMYASKSWEQIFAQVREETNRDFKQVFADRIERGVRPFDEQKTLIPKAFTLP